MVEIGKKVLFLFSFSDDMKLLVDSGSTKAEWVVRCDENEVKRFQTSGINPVVMDEASVWRILECELMAEISEYLYNINKVEFYGAGCNLIGAEKMRSLLAKIFVTAEIIVDSDIIGAAKAVCDGKESIVAILGTGSNSCLVSVGQDSLFPAEMKIVEQTPALGYILGDEGSGAVLGREFLNAVFKGRMPRMVVEAFEKEMEGRGIGILKPLKEEIIDRVYNQPLANRFLASLSPFVHSQIGFDEVENLVVDNFRKFFTNNIRPYNRQDLPVNFVGSMAYHYSEQLKKAAELEGFVVGKIKKTPL